MICAALGVPGRAGLGPETHVVRRENITGRVGPRPKDVRPPGAER